MKVNKRLATAVALWFCSIMLMTLAVSTPEHAHLAGWSILAGMGGCLPIVWLVVDHVVEKERTRSRDELRDIVRVVLQEARELHSV